MTNTPEFDKYAEDYDAVLSQGLSVSGEDKTYFALKRIAWLADCLQPAAWGRAPQRRSPNASLRQYLCT